MSPNNSYTLCGIADVFKSILFYCIKRKTCVDDQLIESTSKSWYGVWIILLQRKVATSVVSLRPGIEEFQVVIN